MSNWKYQYAFNSTKPKSMYANATGGSRRRGARGRSAGGAMSFIGVAPSSGRRFLRRATGLNGRIQKMKASMPSANVSKAVDLPNQAQGFTSTGTSLVLLNGLVEGVSSYQRIGKRSTNVSLSIRGAIAPNTAGTATAHDAAVIRYIVFYDRQVNGVTTNLSDLLKDVDSGGATNSAVNSNANLLFRDRFVILRDRSHIVPAIGAAGATPAKSQGMSVDVTSDTRYSFNLTEYINLGGLPTQYSGTGATTASVQTGGLYIMFLSSNDGSASADASWIAQFNARLRYYDQG